MPRKPKQTVADVPALMDEWDEEENSREGLFPQELGSQSNRSAHWKCKRGHKWIAKISNRYNGRGCPECSKYLRTSFPEQALYFYVKKYHPDAVNRYRDIFPNGMELDVYVPSLKVGVEYDGMAWHKDSGLERERRKYRICKDHGIKLIRIKENREHWDEEGLADEIIRVLPDNTDLLNMAIKFVLTSMDAPRLIVPPTRIDLPSLSRDPLTQTDSVSLTLEEFTRQRRQRKREFESIWGFNAGLDVNVKRDRNLIMESYRVQLEGEPSFASKHPDLVDEWDPVKNGSLTPDMFAEHSSMKVWWICKEHGHSWQASISVRARGNGCPYCAGRLVLAGFNDLQTKCPEVAAQWHPTKNEGKKPTDFTSASGHEAWWLCPVCGQSWKAKINNRTVNGRGCPYCKHERPIPGVNDLPTLRPDLMEEWNYERNAGLNPATLMPASNKKVWWKCKKCGYEYQSMVINRHREGSGCPRCAGQVLIPGVNDLATLYPELAEEWDIEKNGGLKPSEVFAKTNKKYWWIDSFGHSWQASPNNRAYGRNCPYCSGHKVLPGFNDIATTYPEIAAEWHPMKNGSVTPFSVSKGYTKKVWFLCPRCGEEYESFIGNKVKGYGKCPYCSKRKKKH